MGWRDTWDKSVRTTIIFLYECILVSFGCQIEIIHDRGTHVLNQMVKSLTSKFMIQH